jgi:hypothetical protein
VEIAIQRQLVVIQAWQGFVTFEFQAQQATCLYADASGQNLRWQRCSAALSAKLGGPHPRGDFAKRKVRKIRSISASKLPEFPVAPVSPSA